MRQGGGSVLSAGGAGNLHAIDDGGPLKAGWPCLLISAGSALRVVPVQPADSKTSTFRRWSAGGYLDDKLKRIQTTWWTRGFASGLGGLPLQEHQVPTHTTPDPHNP